MTEFFHITNYFDDLNQDLCKCNQTVQ